MSPEHNVYDVHHNSPEMRFEIQVGNEMAVLLYQMDGDAIILYHTFVPPALEGKGIGSQLARAGLEYAKAESLQVVPECSFVEAYIRRHPEFQPLVRS